MSPRPLRPWKVHALLCNIILPNCYHNCDSLFMSAINYWNILFLSQMDYYLLECSINFLFTKNRTHLHIQNSYSQKAVMEYSRLINDWLTIAQYLEIERKIPDYQMRYSQRAPYKQSHSEVKSDWKGISKKMKIHSKDRRIKWKIKKGRCQVKKKILKDLKIERGFRFKLKFLRLN